VRLCVLNGWKRNENCVVLAVLTYFGKLQPPPLRLSFHQTRTRGATRLEQRRDDIVKQRRKFFFEEPGIGSKERVRCNANVRIVDLLWQTNGKKVREYGVVGEK
jgi:hypothetical protein